MDDQAAIVVKGVSKRFVLPHEKISTVKGLFTSAYKKRKKSNEVQRALNDISFTINKGEFFGIVGRNGSGKSTLLKILAGIYQPTSGSVVTKGKLVPFIELGVGFNPELSGRDNVFLNGAMLGFSRKEVTDMYDDIVKFAELERFMDQKLKNYSSGMQVRLAFSMATRSEADILLVDEVLAVGDAAFQRKCFEYFRLLKKNKKTVVFVSHDMNAIREYCDRAILIEKSEIILEGKVNKVASAYTRMFMDGPQEAEQTEEEAAKQPRMGDKRVTFEVVKPSKADYLDMEPIVIDCKVVVHHDIDDLVLGFSIKNQADTQLAGINTQLLGERIGAQKAGDIIKYQWIIPNIFNDGSYYVDVAAHDTAGQNYDWWEEATNFTVFKEKTTAYVTMPDIRFNPVKDDRHA